MNRILIVKTSAIGDVIHTFPVLEYLRQKFSDARIDWVVETGTSKLLSSHPLLSHVIPVDFKKWRSSLFSYSTLQECRVFLSHLREVHYDVLFDLQGNTKSAIVTACAKADVKVGFGWNCVREKANVLATHRRLNVAIDGNVRNKYLALVQGYYAQKTEMISQSTTLKLDQDEKIQLEKIMAQMASGSYLMIAFGSKWPNKQLKTSTLQSFIKAIAERYFFSFLFIYGNAEEKQIAQQFAHLFENKSLAIGDLTLPLWQALMWKVKGVIAVDSAALHLCATTSTPSFSIFGPSHPEVYKPLEERHMAIVGSCPYDEKFLKHCPKLRTCATGACIKDLTVDELIKTFDVWIKRHVTL